MQHGQFMYNESAGRSSQVPIEAVPARVSRAGLANRAPDEGALAAAHLARAIDRLEEVVGQETAALRSRAKVDLKDFNVRKSHGLLELTRAMRLFPGSDPGQPLRTRLAELRRKLETNRAALAMHLEAVREISTIMAEAVQDAESDGTYSEYAARVGPKP